MKRWLILMIFGLAECAGPGGTFAEEDLIALGKSDSGVKPLVFPLSMKVIQNRPQKGLYYFYENNSKRYDEGLANAPAGEPDAFDLMLSDPKVIRQTLLKSDPVRIAPSSRLKDNRGPVTRNTLKELKKFYTTNVLFIFRREVFLKKDPPFSHEVFLRPQALLGEGGAYKVKLRTSGILYLTRQNKILALKPQDREAAIPEGSGKEKIWRSLAEEGLKQLGETAKNTFKAYQFEKRRSAY